MTANSLNRCPKNGIHSNPSYASSNLIFRISCSSSVRFISYPLRGTMTTGQMSCYITGQITNSQQIKPPTSYYGTPEMNIAP